MSQKKFDILDVVIDGLTCFVPRCGTDLRSDAHPQRTRGSAHFDCLLNRHAAQHRILHALDGVWRTRHHNSPLLRSRRALVLRTACGEGGIGLAQRGAKRNAGYGPLGMDHLDIQSRLLADDTRRRALSSAVSA